MVLDFSNVCRLCLINGQNEEMYSLFTEDQEEENSSLSGKVMALTSIEKASFVYSTVSLLQGTNEISFYVCGTLMIPLSL